jgi:CDP-diacylglycerol--glycerol-3-phosphate 3-phosphatidyltransferase
MMTWPNRITVLRILLLTPFLILLLNSEHIRWLRYLAVGVFAVMALCDALDGHLARRYQQRTTLGSILDPLADKLVLTVSVVILTYPDWPGAETAYHIPRWVTVTLLSKDAFILLGVVIMHFVTGRTDLVHPSFLGKAATAATFVLVLVTLVAPDVARVPRAEAPLGWFLIGLGGVAAALAFAACLDYIRIGSRMISAHSGEERI